MIASADNKGPVFSDLNVSPKEIDAMTGRGKVMVSGENRGSDFLVGVQSTQVCFESGSVSLVPPVLSQMSQREQWF